MTRELGGAPGADPQPQAEIQAEATEPADGPPSTWDDPRVPWSGRPRRVDILCWAGIVLSGIYYWALLPFVESQWIVATALADHRGALDDRDAFLETCTGLGQQWWRQQRLHGADVVSRELFTSALRAGRSSRTRSRTTL